MISTPGAAMKDRRVFVTRDDGDYPGLYERYWDGDEWIWVHHGLPDGVSALRDPGAAMLDEKLFVVADDGNLYERHARADLERWVWRDHGRPGRHRIAHGPGAERGNEKLFVVGENGNLYERHWRTDVRDWAWEDHGAPEGVRLVTAPGAAMPGKVFVGGDNGNLYERRWQNDAPVWVDHGRPPRTRVATAPGAAMGDILFVGTADGRLFALRRVADAAEEEWEWRPHRTPPRTKVATAPGEARNDKFFLGGANGHLFERILDTSGAEPKWRWRDHGTPPNTEVATAAGAAMDGKRFVGTTDGRLFELYWSTAIQDWKWVNHGTPLQDRSEHILGRSGPDENLTILVVGDGFAEDDLEDYRELVEDMVLAALRLEPLDAWEHAFRVVRLDLVSLESGVSEKKYDRHGTPAILSDDTTKSEVFRQTRLGIIANDEWHRAWYDLPSDLNYRLAKLKQRFAPQADKVAVLVNSTLRGGVNQGDGTCFNRNVPVETVAHELGHNLFSLGDEYVNDDIHEGDPGSTYPAGSSLLPPNLSEEPTDWNNLKWISLVSPEAYPLPTETNALPSGWDDNTSVGAFEGGGGRFLRGLYRPVIECRMNTNDPPWCPVCLDVIARRMPLYQTSSDSFDLIFGPSRGDQRMRIAVEVGPSSAEIKTMWLAEGPAIQRDSEFGTHVARVDIDGQTVMVQSFDDPRVMRGISLGPGTGHSFRRADRGMITVDVPAPAHGHIVDPRVRIADLTDVADRPTDPGALASLFDDPPAELAMLATFEAPQLREHRDAYAVGPVLGPGQYA
jgi:hypothetical protein